MKNPAPYIRTALVTLLNGTITHDGSPVPCYSGEGELVPYQIIIGDETWSRENDKASFMQDFTQPIEVVSMQATNTKAHVNEIMGSIVLLMTPTPTTKGIADSADFQVLNLEADNPQHISEVAQDGTFINRLIINYRFFINQK